MEGVDERPLAVRRKRRTSTGLSDPATQPAQDMAIQQTGEETSHENVAREPPKTPRNRIKRIRFSEPLEAVASSSTRLTPALNRTRLLPASSTEAARKRLSLPIQLMTPAASPSSPQFPNTPSTTYQFAPLRQAIDPRMMRRLKRNHMAEEVNNIYTGRRQKSKLVLQQEVEDLRKALALARDHGNGPIDATPENTERIVELETEIVSLKEEMRERSTTVDTALPQQAEDEEIMPNGGFANEDGHTIAQITAIEDINEAAIDTTHFRFPTTVVEASTQVDFPSPTISEICRSARLSFEYLFPGENTIGLEISDPQPLIEAMISRVGALKEEVEQKQQTLAVKETSRLNVVSKFNTALTQLESARQQFQTHKEAWEAEKERARSSELEASVMEARWEQANDKRREIEQQRDEHRRSIERLQPALEYYQLEVQNLTKTVLDLESSHEATLKDLRLEFADDSDAALACQQIAFEEAKSDLEAQVAAETIGRRKAEESAVERLDRMKELENRQKEIQSAVHEKQFIIRYLESELENTKSSHENEVGQLNVRIGKLVSDLSSVNAELAATRNEAIRLANLVEEEKAAGLKAVEAMQSEMKKCSNNVDVVKDSHAEGVKKRGEEVAQSFGLMTPVVEGGKFRDAEADEKVEGHVQYMRGKKRMSRPDSGVEVWGSIAEEAEEEGGVLMEE